MTMQFGMFTCGYQYLPLETAFRDAAAIGYDYIELWGGYPHAYAPDLLAGGAAGIRQLSEKWQVPVRIYTPEHNAYPFNYMMGSLRQWENCMEYLTQAFRAATMIGAEKTLISVGHGGMRPAEERWERLLRSLEELSRRAEEEGQTILLETLTPMESNTCTTVRELKKALDAVDRPNLLGMCDVVPPYVQGEDPADYVRLLGARMGHVHLVDGDGVSETHLVPGEGVMPLRKILQDFRQCGYDGTATIELVTNYLSDPTYYARLALERAKELL